MGGALMAKKELAHSIPSGSADFAPLAPLREVTRIRVHLRPVLPFFAVSHESVSSCAHLCPASSCLPSPPLLLYHSASHKTASVPLSRAHDDSHGPGGAGSMSALSNHTSTPLLLIAQDCSLPPLAKGGAGGFGTCWKNPGRSAFSKARWYWKAKLLGSLPSAFRAEGHEGDHDLYPCLEPRWKRSAEADGCGVRGWGFGVLCGNHIRPQAASTMRYSSLIIKQLS